MRDEFTHPFTNVSGTAVEVWQWIRNSITHFTWHVITYPCWDECWSKFKGCKLWGFKFGWPHTRCKCHALEPYLNCIGTIKLHLPGKWDIYWFPCLKIKTVVVGTGISEGYLCALNCHTPNILIVYNYQVYCQIWHLTLTHTIRGR